jgi:hypothetical protein
MENIWQAFTSIGTLLVGIAAVITALKHDGKPKE